MSESPTLPRGWAFACLDDLLIDIEAGKSFQCVERPPSDDEVGVVKVSAVTWGEYDEEESKTCTDPGRFDVQLLVQLGDFLFSRANTIELVGACVIARRVTKRVMLSDKVLRLRFADVAPEWVMWALRTREGRDEIERLATGNQMSMRNIAQPNIRRIRIPLPPLAEQRRIVAAIEQQFTRLDAGVAALRRAQAALKRYRAAVLKAAVEGTLTEAWRAEHPDVEPASALLARILAERRARWGADLRAKGKDPAKARYVEPVAPDKANLPGLPEGWCWTTVEQIGQIQGGIQKQPARAPHQNAYPYLRVANVLRGRLDLSEIERMELFGNELNTLRLQAGDLLIVEGNGSRTEVGRSALWSGEINDCVHQNHIIRVRLIEGHPRYLDYYWNSPDGNKRVMDVAASTSGLYTLSVGKIAKLPVPWPPLAEQEQIVAEVERRLSVVSELEVEVDANLKRAERLRQSILREAFAGRLVPQDPDDEPASVLLERIGASEAARRPS